ncbi:MAG: ECF transporter S component [Lachnospiraceae bacterium]|nr:ECF transporter S component [Lachnospiraceae bacterium]
MANSNGRASTARYAAVTGVLAAVAFVLMYIEFPIPMLMPAFIKFDFSDLPALIGSFAMGPLCGVMVELVKNLIHLPFTSSGGVGEISNFLLGAIFVAVAGIVYRKSRNKKGAVIGSVVGAVAMAVTSVATNYFVVYPFYYNFMPKEAVLGAYQVILPSVKSILQALIVFNVPFTFCKGMIDVLITFLIYKHISPILKGTRH